MDLHWGIISEYSSLFVRGAITTLEATAIAVVLGTFLGLFVGLGRLSKLVLLRWPAVAYITFFRGTPLFVQILIIHFGLRPILINVNDGLLITGDLARFINENYGAFFSGILALTLNAGAYIAEIFRAGIQSIDRGQMEAARSLGMTNGQAMRLIIIPQAFRRMLPPLGNEAIALLKDSSLVSAIGMGELAYAARTVFGATSRVWEPYLTISAVYLVLTLGLSVIVSWLERRFGQGDSR